MALAARAHGDRGRGPRRRRARAARAPRSSSARRWARPTSSRSSTTRGSREGARGDARARCIPKYGSTLLPDPRRARDRRARAWCSRCPRRAPPGNYAIGFAADLIRAGRADVVITGAAEILQELQFAGFVRLAAMAPRALPAVRPEPPGPHPRRGRGHPRPRVARRTRFAADAHVARRGRRLRPDVRRATTSRGRIPDAAGQHRRDAPGDRALAASRPTTSTSSTRTAPARKPTTPPKRRSCSDVFGDRRVPISSMKSMLGHCMGAASALEAIGCVMTLETGIYPPTIGYETPDPECDVDVVANVARDRQGRHRAQQLARVRRLQRGHVLREARACCPTRRTVPTHEQPEQRSGRRASSPASGSASALGIGREAFFRALDGAPRASRRAARSPIESFDASKYDGRARSPRCRDFDATKYLGDKGLRTLDRLTKLLVVAARLGAARRGLQEGQRVRPRSRRSASASCCSNAYGSLEAITELDRVAKLEDARYINPAKFPNTVANSASGYVSIWEDLRALNVSVSRRQLRRARRRRVRRRLPRERRAPTRSSSAAARR